MFRRREAGSRNWRIGRYAAAAAATLALLAASAAGAEPPVEEKRRQAELILAQVQELGAEVGAAAERFNGANYRLELLSGRLRSARADLVRTRRQLGLARSRGSDRLVELYVNGGDPSTLELVLEATSMRDVLDVLETNQRMVAQDARIVTDLRHLAGRTRKREQQLAASRLTQRRLVGQLESERDAIAGKLAERQELLGSVQAEVERLEAAERVRQAELRRQAKAELARQRALAAAQASRRAETVRETAPESVPEPEREADAAVATTSPPVEALPAPEPEPPPAPPADASRGAQVVAIAMRYLGVPYRWGGASPATGFDCSGFTMFVFAQIGVSLPHYAAAQYGLGRAVSKSELQPGDLVFFRGLGHMGMYIGGGNFIHSPQTGDVVKISSVSDRAGNWVGARRVL